MRTTRACAKLTCDIATFVLPLISLSLFLAMLISGIIVFVTCEQLLCFAQLKVERDNIQTC